MPNTKKSTDKNHKIATRQGYILSKSELSKKQITKIRKELTVVPKLNPDYMGDVEGFPVFNEDKNYFCVPKYYGVENFGKPVKNKIKHEKIDICFNGNLRPNQQQVANTCIKKIKKIGGGILSLPTGYGKTVLALYIAQQLGVKTFVLVNKTFLQDQWYDRIKSFTDARIGMVRQSKTDVENKDIVIGMLQSVSLIDYDPEIFNDIGLLIVDECHHNASRVFSKAFLKIGATYTIGLSATPERADGLTKVLHWHLGDVLAHIVRKGDRNVLIKALKYESDNNLYVEKKRWFKGNIKPDAVKMVSNLCKIPERNTLLINSIYHLMYQYERKILILSDRIEHLHILKDGLDKMIKKDIASGKIDEDEYKTAYYIGKMKQYELEDASDADVIFASYAMAAEGLDIDKLNTLVLATPKKNVIQSIGRILRKPIKEGMINPLIVDVFDEFSIFTNWSSVRQNYYDKCKYKTTSYQAYNEKVISIEEYLKLHGIISKKAKKVDVRKEYMIYKYGKGYYEIEKDMDFEDHHESMYIYDTDMMKIFNTSGEKIIEEEDMNQFLTIII